MSKTSTQILNEHKIETDLRFKSFDKAPLRLDSFKGLLPDTASMALLNDLKTLEAAVANFKDIFSAAKNTSKYHETVKTVKQLQTLADKGTATIEELVSAANELWVQFVESPEYEESMNIYSEAKKLKEQAIASSKNALEIYSSYSYYLTQGGRTFILTDNLAKSQAIPNRHFKHLYTLLPSSAAKEEAANIPYYTLTPKGDDKPTNVCQAFIDSPNRRDLCGITFDPSTTGRIVRDEFNIWRGWRDFGAFEPGDDEPFWRLVRERICGGSEQYFEFVQKWLAHMVQKPQERPLCALGIKGGQGTGKTSFVKIVGNLMHERHYNENVTVSMLTGSEMGKDLEGILLAYVDEATFGGDISKTGFIKKCVTGEVDRINEKFVPSYNVPTYKRIIFTSNESYYYHADKDDRRLLPLEVPEELGKLSHEHSQELFDGQNLRPNLQAALLNTLRTIDISSFVPAKALQELEIHTGADLMELSMSSDEQWFKYSLNNKCFELRDQFGIKVIDHDCISVRELQESYALFCSNDSFMKNRQKSLSSPDIRKKLIRYFGHDSKNMKRDGEQARRYSIDWHLMKKNFIADFKWNLQWDDEEPMAAQKTSPNVYPLLGASELKTRTTKSTLEANDAPAKKSKLQSIANRFSNIQTDWRDE